MLITVLIIIHLINVRIVSSNLTIKQDNESSNGTREVDNSESANQRGIYRVSALSLINRLIRVISLLGLVMVCALSTVGLWQSKVQSGTTTSSGKCCDAQCRFRGLYREEMCKRRYVSYIQKYQNIEVFIMSHRKGLTINKIIIPTNSMSVLIFSRLQSSLDITCRCSIMTFTSNVGLSIVLSRRYSYRIRTWEKRAAGHCARDCFLRWR